MGDPPEQTIPQIGLAILIDDEQIDQMIYRRVLQRSGLVRETLTFSMAVDALEYLKRRDRPEVDVIFLDINMPRMNGFEFLTEATREFGDSFAKMVIVMLTTSIDPRDRERAEAFSAVRKFLYKPLNIEQLADVARMVAATPAH